MAATIKDIAKRTGLGLATISSYLNGGNVRDKNKIKIEEAILDLNFEINELARSLKTNRSKTIGVVIAELNNIFCTEIIIEIEDILRNHGYATMVCDCRTNKTLEKEAIEFLYRKRVDGIINMPVNVDGSYLSCFQTSKKPIVLIDRKLNGLDCDCVLVDNMKATKNAVQLLIKNGHTKIGLIGGPQEVFTAQERLLGYKSAMMEEGIAPEERFIVHGDYTIKGGVTCLEKLVKMNSDMTAVLVVNYEMTMGAMIAINELGIKVPEELSFVGYDNSEFARACKPQLVIVTQPTKLIAEHAATIMLERLKEKVGQQTSQSKIIKLQTEIISGNSIKKI